MYATARKVVGIVENAIAKTRGVINLDMEGKVGRGGPTLPNVVLDMEDGGEKFDRRDWGRVAASRLVLNKIIEDSCPVDITNKTLRFAYCGSDPAPYISAMYGHHQFVHGMFLGQCVADADARIKMKKEIGRWIGGKPEFFPTELAMVKHKKIDADVFVLDGLKEHIDATYATSDALRSLAELGIFIVKTRERNVEQGVHGALLFAVDEDWIAIRHERHWFNLSIYVIERSRHV